MEIEAQHQAHLVALGDPSDCQRLDAELEASPIAVPAVQDRAIRVEQDGLPLPVLADVGHQFVEFVALHHREDGGDGVGLDLIFGSIMCVSSRGWRGPGGPGPLGGCYMYPKALGQVVEPSEVNARSVSAKR